MIFLSNIIYRALRPWRLLSAGLRGLPDFLIIGAMKSGTTSLFHCLAQHPELIPAYRKEVHYFDQTDADFASRTGNLTWYQSHFPIKAMIRPRSLIYEATPKYLCHLSSAKRISMVIPNTRLVLLLRNPTQRAISHYFYRGRNPPDPKLLHDAMIEDIARRPLLEPTGDIVSGKPDYMSYVGRGIYRPQIERFLEYFDPADLHVIESQQFFEMPAPVLADLFEFLGVRSDFPIRNLTARNVSLRRQIVWPCTLKLLDDFFRPHNELLFELLGTRFNWHTSHA